jgi:GT2 family glycosyltransferase
MIDVSVCIVNWNTRELLARCLDSIAAHAGAARVQVIVVDNASSDDSAAMVRARFPAAHLIASASNLGFAHGSNLAAAAAVGRHVLYLNPDTELVSDAIDGLARFLDTHPGHGAAGCRLLNSDGSIQLTCASALPSMRNELASLLFLDRLFPRRPWAGAREMAWWDHADSRDVDCLSGACMMLSRDLAQRLGGFDARHFMYGEDLDLCLRVRALGLRLRYVAEEAVFHHEGAASRKRGRNFAPLRQRCANFLVLRRHRGLSSALGYRLAVGIGAGVRLLACIAGAPLWLARSRAGLSDWGGLTRRHGELVLWSFGLMRSPAS